MKTEDLGIIRRPGNNNVLLVAPHGFNGDDKLGLKPDDENTAELALAIADLLDAYAVCNNLFRRPRRGESFDPAKNIADLNLKKHFTDKRLEGKFLAPIRAYLKEILERHAEAIVFYVHGASDKNVDKVASRMKISSGKLDVLIGYGQAADGKSRFTSDRKRIVDPLIAGLREKGIQAEIVIPESKGTHYCGWDRRRMNQYFHYWEPIPHMQSVQLEIRANLRKEEAYMGRAEQIAGAVEDRLLTPNVNQQKRVQAAEKRAVPKVPVPEDAPDEKLVNEAVDRIKEILARTVEAGMVEVGQYIIEKFYGGDVNAVRSRNPKKPMSLNALHKREDLGTSRAWLSNAVNLAAEYQELITVQSIKQLPQTHKVALLQLKDKPQRLKEVADQAQKEGWSAKRLREVVKEVKDREKPTKKEGLPKLTTLIDDPERFCSEEAEPLKEMERLQRLRNSTIERLLSDLEEMLSIFNREIMGISEYKEAYQEFAKSLAGILKSRKEASKTAMKTEDFEALIEKGSIEEAGELLGVRIDELAEQWGRFMDG